MEWMSADLVEPSAGGGLEQGIVQLLSTLYIEALAAAFVFVLLLVLLLTPRGASVYRFWCRRAGRDVEVTLVGRRVCACTAFEEATEVVCGRECRDPAFRSLSAPRAPVAGPAA